MPFPARFAKSRLRRSMAVQRSGIVKPSLLSQVRLRNTGRTGDLPEHQRGNMSSQNDLVSLIGRILLGLVFFIAGIDKIMGLEGTIKYATAAGMPMANIAVYLSIVIEVGMGLLLFVGFKTRWASAVLIVFILVAIFYFHQYWNMEGAARNLNKIMLFKNLALVGGLLMLMVAGPGRYSMDARR
jgi:putative oxidoreductase